MRVRAPRRGRRRCRSPSRRSACPPTTASCPTPFTERPGPARQVDGLAGAPARPASTPASSIIRGGTHYEFSYIPNPAFGGDAARDRPGRLVHGRLDGQGAQGRPDGGRAAADDALAGRPRSSARSTPDAARRQPVLHLLHEPPRHRARRRALRLRGPARGLPGPWPPTACRPTTRSSPPPQTPDDRPPTPTPRLDAPRPAGADERAARRHRPAGGRRRSPRPAAARRARASRRSSAASGVLRITRHARAGAGVPGHGDARHPGLQARQEDPRASRRRGRRAFRARVRAEARPLPHPPRRPARTATAVEAAKRGQPRRVRVRSGSPRAR